MIFIRTISHRMKLEMKKTLENEIKNLKLVVLEKDNSLAGLTKQLETERDEKMILLEERDRVQEEWSNQKNTWRIENEDLRMQRDEMIEMAKKVETNNALQRERLLSEVDTNEIHEAYQRALKDKEVIESENYMLKEELNKFQKQNMYAYNHHTRSISNASSQNEEDIGYSSAKNTLEIRSTGGETGMLKKVLSLIDYVY